MSVFYVLPPRALVQESLIAAIRATMPDLPIQESTILCLLENSLPLDTFLVFREDLPDDEPLSESLVAAFGMEPEDRMIVVKLCAVADEPILRAAIRRELSYVSQVNG